MSSESLDEKNAMKSRLTPETRPDVIRRCTEAIPSEAFAAILRKLNKDDPVSLRLVNGTSITGVVDLVSMNGNVVWLITTGGRQMFISDDVSDIAEIFRP